jgi:CubicO group peptidase (beta-lactamase class C family)
MINNAMLDGIRIANMEWGLGLRGVHVYTPKGVAFARFCENERHHLYSGSKTFASMAIGIAVGEKRFSLEDKALDFFPDLCKAAPSGNEDITVKDLLQMRAGKKHWLFTSIDYPPEDSMDWAEAFFRQEQAHPAGTRYLYDNGCTYVLSRIIEATSGQTLRDYLVPRLFSPLGINNPLWRTCHKGHSLGAIGLYLATDEFARLGRLMLQNGEWEGKQLVPPGYVKKAHTDLVTTEGFWEPECNCGYGYQLWACARENTYRADGKFGQFSIVLEDLNAVVTITAHNEHNVPAILSSVWTDVIPRL